MICRSASPISPLQSDMNSDVRSLSVRVLRMGVIALNLAVLSACGYVVETNLFAPPARLGGFRQEITLTNTGSPLSNYTVRLSIDASNTEFWENIENDGSTIRFAESDGATSIPFFLDYFDSVTETAVLHVRVSQLPVGDTTIYLYFGGSSEQTGSSPSQVFLFYDDFEDGDVSDWTNIPPGEVRFRTDGSNGVLLKTSDSDPTGGYIALPGAVSGYEAIWRTNRINENGGAANRYALEDNGGNGYGPQISNFGSGETFVIEERSGGTGSALTTDGSPPSLNQNTWYLIVFRRAGDDMELDLYDEEWALIDSISATDGTVSTVTRFVVRGGYEFLTDDIRIREYASPDPTAAFGPVEAL